MGASAPRPTSLSAARPGATRQWPPAGIRTRVHLPLTLAGEDVEADLVTFDGLVDGGEHLALGLGDYAGAARPLVRVHSECLTGDVLGSRRCDCGPQLHEAIRRVRDAGGYLLYLRQEGRGIGLYNKLDAYALQDAGLDTYQANVALRMPEDARDYTVAAQMLTALEVAEFDLLTNNPDKASQLRGLGMRVLDSVTTGVFANPENLRYLQAKVRHTGHSLALPPRIA